MTLPVLTVYLFKQSEHDLSRVYGFVVQKQGKFVQFCSGIDFTMFYNSDYLILRCYDTAFKSLWSTMLWSNNTSLVCKTVGEDIQDSRQKMNNNVSCPGE